MAMPASRCGRLPARRRELAQLADVLVDCVAGGASVSFMHPLPRDRARVLACGRRGCQAGERVLLVAEDAQGICSTVQLILAQPSQPHRADLAKMLVHRRPDAAAGAAYARGGGSRPRERKNHTGARHASTPMPSGCTNAWAGSPWAWCPDHALLPQGGFCDTRFYYRRLAP